MWGHKHVFAGDSNSFCGTLSRAVGGFKGRPKNAGPYTLVICYKHKGHSFYKEYQYNAREELIIEPPKAGGADEKIVALLAANKNNLSFIGEKLCMTKEEFSLRFKKLPMLSELMRMNLSLKQGFIAKTKVPLTVEVFHERKRLVVVNFHEAGEVNAFETPEYETPGEPTQGPIVKEEGGVFIIQLPCVYKEDLLAEVKGRILSAINKKLDQLSTKDVIPSSLDPSIYMNHALQFFSGSAALDDYQRVSSIVFSSNVIK